jgi:3-oxoacyl-[acyl-carrier protein] reductase
MKLGIEGKRALVMGGSSGIGLAIAKSLADEGARVAISARNPEKLERAASEIGAELFEAADLYSPDQAAKTTSSIERQMAGIDILVTHNGGPPKGRFQDLSRKDWQRGFDGLWQSAVESIQVALPGMRGRKWGRILLVTSIAAKEPLFGLPVSSGLRAGLLGLAKSLSSEVARDGVTVNSILPGYTATDEICPDPDLISWSPSSLFASAREQGALAAFLASEQAGYITGQAIACDGGFLRGI